MNKRIRCGESQPVEQGVGNQQALKRIAVHRRRLAHVEHRLVVEADVTEIVAGNRVAYEGGGRRGQDQSAR